MSVDVAEGVTRLAEAIAAEMNSTIQPDDPDPCPVAPNSVLVVAAAAAAFGVLNLAIGAEWSHG